MTRARTVIFIVIGALSGLARQAAAQTTQTTVPSVPNGTFAPLAAKLNGNESVTVTDMNGHQFKGRITLLTADQLTVVSRERTQTFRVSDVGRIQERDALRDGIGTGAAAGLVAVFLVTVAGCGGDFSGCAVYALPLVPLFVGGGAGVGAAVDALITKTLFTRTSGAVHLAVQPMPRGAAVHIRLAF